ncbi:MAG: glycoside hydrolase family 1 protein, partial [Methylocystis sp.]|nr:glycoside hydrolase family 1 protein [Methylocystis sp.]
YRPRKRPHHEQLVQMGLWDLDPEPTGRLDRIETPLVDAYRRLTSGGASAVGPLAPTPRLP